MHIFILYCLSEEGLCRFTVKGPCGIVAKTTQVRRKRLSPGDVSLQLSGTSPPASLLCVKEFEADGLHNKPAITVSADSTFTIKPVVFYSDMFVRWYVLVPRTLAITY